MRGRVPHAIYFLYFSDDSEYCRALLFHPTMKLSQLGNQRGSRRGDFGAMATAFHRLTDGFAPGTTRG